MMKQNYRLTGLELISIAEQIVQKLPSLNAEQQLTAQKVLANIFKVFKILWNERVVANPTIDREDEIALARKLMFRLKTSSIGGSAGLRVILNDMDEQHRTATRAVADLTEQKVLPHEVGIAILRQLNGLEDGPYRPVFVPKEAQVVGQALSTNASPELAVESLSIIRDEGMLNKMGTHAHRAQIRADAEDF